MISQGCHTYTDSEKIHVGPLPDNALEPAEKGW